LLKNSKPIIGVYNHPILNDFLIGDNQETKINDTVTKIRECNNLSDAVLLTTDHLNVEKYQNIEKFNNLIKKIKQGEIYHVKKNFNFTRFSMYIFNACFC